MKLFLSSVFLSLFFFSAVTYAQPTDIRHADGSPLESTYCHYDENIQIEGVPAGGSFSGCGVFQQGNDWYFNPAIAATGAAGAYSCSLTYTLGSEKVEKYFFVHNEIRLYLTEDAIVCGDTFFLYGDMSLVGAFEWSWSGPGVILGPSYKGTYAVLPTGSRGVYVFYAKNLNNGCEASDSVVIETRERLDFQFTAGDTIYHTPGMRLLLETRANRGYRVVSWSPAHLFPDQTALQQSVAIDSPVRITATAISEDDSCTTAVSTRVLFWPAGISQQSAHQQVMLYPNPATHELQIRGAEPFTVLIRDIEGRIALQHQMKTAGELLDVRSLSPGVYLVCLTDELGKMLLPQRLVKTN